MLHNEGFINKYNEASFIVPKYVLNTLNIHLKFNLTLILTSMSNYFLLIGTKK